MPDEFQQLKGVLGQEIAKLYLKYIRHYVIVAEEVAVKGLNSRSRLDLVVRDEEGYRPVEVKFQEYNVPSYGKVFGYVLSQIHQGTKVYALIEEKYVALSRPILFLWYPPSKKISAVDGYNNVELFQFGEVVKALNGQIAELVSQAITDKVIRFFKKNRQTKCQLTQSQQKQMEDFYPNWHRISAVEARRLVNIELMKKVGQMIMAGEPEQLIEEGKVYWKVPFLVVPPDVDTNVYPIGKYALIDSTQENYELDEREKEEIKAASRPILYELYSDLKDWMRKIQEV